MFKALLKMMAENFSVVFVLVAIIYATVNVLVYDIKAVEAFLASFLFWCVGCQGIGACVLHWYRPTADKIAEGIGWAPGSPFQKEVAAAAGGFGILGILSSWIGGDFWTATAIGASFMYFLMGIGHVLDIVKTKNTSIYNAGSVLYTDLLVPVVLIALLILWKMGY